MLLLEGRGAVITGAASGIGRATALRFAAEGARVLLADVQEASGEAAAAEIRAGGCEARFVATDVSRVESVEALFRAASEWLPQLDLVVHAAGILRGAFQQLEQLDLETWNAVISVNLTGTFLCAKYAAPALE